MTNEPLKITEEKMRSAVEALRKELVTIRTGHATPALLEHLKVNYAGVPTPLNQVAGISAPAARLLVIQPWDKSSLGQIEKSILKSDLGLTPTSDGSVIRINIPPLSDERRQDLVKLVHTRLEKERVVIRNLRRDTAEELKKNEKNKEISQDELRRQLDQLQKITDAFIAKVDQVGQEKETDIREV